MLQDMKRAVTASLMALILSVSLVEPAWAFDRKTVLDIDAISGGDMRLLVTLSLIAEQNPPDDCKEDVPVVIQRRSGRRWLRFASGRTDQNGRLTLRRARRSGRYRARAKAFTTEAGNQCFESTSQPVTFP